jgi:hypothetical protein
MRENYDDLLPRLPGIAAAAVPSGAAVAALRTAGFGLMCLVGHD